MLARARRTITRARHELFFQTRCVRGRRCTRQRRRQHGAALQQRSPTARCVCRRDAARGPHYLLVRGGARACQRGRHPRLSRSTHGSRFRPRAVGFSSWLVLCGDSTHPSPFPLCGTMHPAGHSSYPGDSATPGGRPAGGGHGQPSTSLPYGSGDAAPPAPFMPPGILGGPRNRGGLNGTNDGLFYSGPARPLLSGGVTDAPFFRGGVPWSASPVSQEEEGTDTVLSWPNDPRRRIVGNGRDAGHATTPGGPALGVFPSGAGVAGLPPATSPARYAASSPPAALSGSTDMASTPVVRGRATRPAMHLSFLPLRSTAPSSSVGEDVGPPLMADGLDRVMPESPLAVTAGVPPSGRRPRAAPRTRSPSPKRRTAANARGARAAPSPPAPVTLESLAAIMASGFKDADGELVKIQKAVDGVSSIVSTHAEKFNNMAVLAESVTTAQGATASAVADLRATAAKIGSAGQGARAGASEKSSKLGTDEQRTRDRKQANAVKVCLRRVSRCVRLRRECYWSCRLRSLFVM